MYITKLFDKPISGNLGACDASRCCVFPQSTVLSDGTIACLYRVGTEKYSWDGKLILQLSHDTGETWSRPIMVFDGLALEPPLSVLCGGLCETSDGELFATFVAVDVFNPDLYLFSEAGQRQTHFVYATTSNDGGLSWSAPRGIDYQPFISAGPTCKPHVLPNGALFVPVEVRMPSGIVGTAATFSNDGLSFQPLSLCVADPSGELNYCDARFAVMDDGRLLMLLWTFCQNDERTIDVHYSSSVDGGRTWSTPEPTGIPGQIATPLVLPSGDILIATNHRMPPDGIQLWMLPGGKVDRTLGPVQMWSARHQMVVAEPVSGSNVLYIEGVWDSLAGFTFGTPDLLNLKDGSVMMTYYAVVDGITHIRACRFLVERAEAHGQRAPIGVSIAGESK